MNQWKYAADDGHKFHPRRQCAKSAARRLHFQCQPMRQSRPSPPVLENNQQSAALPGACPDSGRAGQFSSAAAYCTDIITPL